MNIELVTTIFLVSVFICAEFYRIYRGKAGTVVAYIEGYPGTELLITKVRIELAGGETVTADLNACTACLGRIGIGTEVRVTESREGYAVHLPWFRTGRCSGRPGHPMSRGIANS